MTDYPFAFIPSPASGVLVIGPLDLHAYGLAIALGVLAAVWLCNKRWQALGGTADDITALATWGVPAGIIGSRVYHVITDYQLYTDHPLRALEIWDGGLGIWGGIAAGVGVGLLVCKQRGLPLLTLMDVVAPALALAQGIGRWGNYFNQELFGRPTTLPWALEIDPVHRPDGYSQFTTFHPTFLYESIWNLALAAVLVFVGKRFRLRAGHLFGIYVLGYTFARFFIERIRIDDAHHIAGLRLNEWTSIVVFATTAMILAVSARRTPAPASIIGATSATNETPLNPDLK